MSSKGTVYIVDDDAIIRRSLGMVLKQAGFTPHPFVSGVDFIESLDYLEDGCVLLDMHMPGLTGREVQEELVERHNKMPLLVMTGDGDIPMAVDVMKRGALDFIEKPFNDAVLIERLDKAFSRMDSVQPEQARHREAARRINGLTPRERDVLEMLTQGKPNKHIAFELGLSVRTIEMHRGNIMRKLDIHSTAEALRIALDAQH